jgi:ATP synthase protein I
MNTISMSTNSSEDPRAEKSRPDRDAGDRGLMPIWRLSSIGIEMGVAVFVGWLMGHYLDKWLHTDPWMMIIFSLLGVVAGFKGMIAAAREATADAKRKSSSKEGE